ncbi:unnamed protein product, partial [marine sediment metagenome]
MRQSFTDTIGSDVGSGVRSARVTIGAGLFRIDMLSVSSTLTTDPVQPVYVYFEMSRGDGSY